MKIYFETFFLNKSSVRHLHGRWRVDGGRQRVVMSGITALWTTLYEQAIRMTFFDFLWKMLLYRWDGESRGIEKSFYDWEGCLRGERKCRKWKMHVFNFFLGGFFSPFDISIFCFFSQTTDISQSCGYNQVNWLSV